MTKFLSRHACGGGFGSYVRFDDLGESGLFGGRRVRGIRGVKVNYEGDVYGFDITDLNFYKCFLAPIDTPHKDMEIQPSSPSIGILIMPKLKDMQTSSYTLLIMFLKQAVAETSLVAVLFCDR
jgi:hypothetical protein